MDLFEYQGKQYFARYGIPVSPGDVADTVDEAVAVADRIGYPVVVKAQVQIGGRGKAGGIKLANNAEEVRQHAGNILGMDIRGHVVHRLWIEKASDIKEEYYASFTLDRSKKLHLGMLSAQGGVEIESVPDDKIAQIRVDPNIGLTEEMTREWVAAAGLPREAVEGAVDVLQKLYNAYVEGDASLVEINPLILRPDGGVHALDAKVSLDSAAAFRHEEWNEFVGLESRDEREREAEEKGLQYVGLDGSVGIIANGAGLAMSTVDIVNQVGGAPANFLDIGGGADADRMVDALTVINHDHNVKVIFINIFGGITRCDDVANGIVQAMQRVDLRSPLVVRLDGTNAKEGHAILDAHKSDKLIKQPDMLNAAKEAVSIAGGN
ncbi:MAG: ADP-forming succinate--CoA ligase subunit beta [Anaerolineae bacterium]|nr:ADP-forming succinate--CoA ligase subunit beta [Anaerolineae bacterium]MCB9458215.1 ADP-forming succinate--CoA ligase subunit beta [Anaerolineaceae bacterium]